MGKTEQHEFTEMHVYLADGKVYIQGDLGNKSFILRPNQRRLLCLLMQKAPQPVANIEIERELWRGIISRRFFNATQAVRSLRKASSPYHFIETLSREAAHCIPHPEKIRILESLDDPRPVNL